MKVIYPTTDGTLTVIHPTGALSVEEVARKDVPFGIPYLLVEDDSIPADRSARGAWEADFGTPDGFGIGAQRWFIEQAEAELLNVVSRAAPSPAALLTAEGPDSLVFPDDADSEQRAALYQAYVAEVAKENERIAARNAGAQAAFEKQKQDDAARCLATIAQMKAEVLQLEGVQL